MVALPKKYGPCDDSMPCDCFSSPCCSCGILMVCNQSTTICKSCSALYTKTTNSRMSMGA